LKFKIRILISKLDPGFSHWMAIYAMLKKFSSIKQSKVFKSLAVNISVKRLGSVAGPVIQTTGRSESEDGLGSGVGLLISHEQTLEDLLSMIEDHDLLSNFA
jgi:hypothetical protein